MLDNPLINQFCTTMLFDKKTYTDRRNKLKELVGGGFILFFGNNDAPYNYPSNVYKFRQDSCFLYYFGQHRDGLAGVIDIDNDQLELVERLEEEGKIIVIRPEKPVVVDRIERNIQKLEDLYHEGYACAQRILG